MTTSSTEFRSGISIEDIVERVYGGFNYDTYVLIRLWRRSEKASAGCGGLLFFGMGCEQGRSDSGHFHTEYTSSI